jgi:hypothetical protein
MPRAWDNPSDGLSSLSFNFDHFAMACQTLFEVSTYEQWSTYVFQVRHMCGELTAVRAAFSRYGRPRLVHVHAWLEAAGVHELPEALSV